MKSLNRAVAVALVTAVLTATAAPAVQARPLTKSQTSFRLTSGDWLDAALVWLGQLFATAPQAPESLDMQKKAPSTDPTGGSGGITPMTGSCIDPNGCHTGGGGGGAGGH
ncbi:MAG TPA: hypothetical protein VGG03_17710 [Thermoanaerobaculia bacterium]|jgi:hypothetical protein